MKKKILLTIALFILPLCLLFSNELTNLISEKLQKMYNLNPELSIGAPTCNVGTFTWQDSGIGTSFSSYLQKRVQDAVVKSGSFNLILSDTQPFIDPETVKIFSDTPEMIIGNFLIFGNYTTAESYIKLKITIFSNTFSKVMAEADLKLPMELVPAGMQVIPADQGRIKEISEKIDNLYGKSKLDIYVTTSRGAGGVFFENEYMKIFLLASENCYVKMYLIGVDGHVVQIFPNQYESNNFLPGKQMLQFPGKSSPFKFRLVPPLGTEAIKVIASTRQFSDIGQGFKDLGMVTRGILITKTENEEKETMAEAKVFYTILPNSK